MPSKRCQLIFIIPLTKEGKETWIPDQSLSSTPDYKRRGQAVCNRGSGIGDCRCSLIR